MISDYITPPCTCNRLSYVANTLMLKTYTKYFCNLTGWLVTESIAAQVELLGGSIRVNMTVAMRTNLI